MAEQQEPILFRLCVASLATDNSSFLALLRSNSLEVIELSMMIGSHDLLIAQEQLGVNEVQAAQLFFKWCVTLQDEFPFYPTFPKYDEHRKQPKRRWFGEF